MIGYKAFDKDLKCRGFQFEVGKTYSTGRKKEELEMCTDTVFHFCRELHRIEYESYYILRESRVCEVIAVGDVIKKGLKFGTNKIMILRELTREEINELGKRNSGDQNSGKFNSGDKNSGKFNSGDRNSGDYNSGCWNSGEQNSGNRNSGNYNSGSCNSGSWNSGGWNSGNWNSGFFNTDSPKLRFFNKSTKLKRGDITFPAFLFFEPAVWVSHDTATDEEKIQHKEEIEATGGFLKTLEYKEAFARAYEMADKEEHGRLFALPNFDPAIFEEISGIDTADEYAAWKASIKKVQQ